MGVLRVRLMGGVRWYYQRKEIKRYFYDVQRRYFSGRVRGIIVHPICVLYFEKTVYCIVTIFVLEEKYNRKQLYLSRGVPWNPVCRLGNGLARETRNPLRSATDKREADSQN